MQPTQHPSNANLWFTTAPQMLTLRKRDAAQQLGLSVHTFRQVAAELGVSRWPYRFISSAINMRACLAAWGAADGSGTVDNALAVLDAHLATLLTLPSTDGAMPGGFQELSSAITRLRFKAKAGRYSGDAGGTPPPAAPPSAPPAALPPASPPLLPHCAAATAVAVLGSAHGEAATAGASRPTGRAPAKAASAKGQPKPAPEDFEPGPPPPLQQLLPVLRAFLAANVAGNNANATGANANNSSCAAACGGGGGGNRSGSFVTASEGPAFGDGSMGLSADTFNSFFDANTAASGAAGGAAASRSACAARLDLWAQALAHSASADSSDWSSAAAAGDEAAWPPPPLPRAAAASYASFSSRSSFSSASVQAAAARALLSVPPVPAEIASHWDPFHGAGAAAPAAPQRVLPQPGAGSAPRVGQVARGQGPFDEDSARPTRKRRAVDFV